MFKHHVVVMMPCLNVKGFKGQTAIVNETDFMSGAPALPSLCAAWNMKRLCDRGISIVLDFITEYQHMLCFVGLNLNYITDLILIR